MSQFEPRPFGKYFLTDRIAIGGMAEIYKAKTFGVDGFEKTLAIKKILANYSADKDFITMLTDEAKLVVNLSHPNIVQIYDLGRVGDDYFISMEFIDGVNLRELVNRVSEINQKIPPDVCLYIAAEICKGLDYAHTKRGPDGKALEIVHRDVSPHNILVSFEGDAKIVDFGIAKAALNVSQTQMGTLKGKVTYMSPEQAVGKPVDNRTDIFSLGIVLYELLSFERLFTGDSQLEVLNLIRNTRITEDTLKGKVPNLALKIMAKALAYNPRDRYQSAADMQVDITRLLYSKFNDFAPRKLADLLRQWYGRATVIRTPDPLPAYETQSLMMTSQEQINIVHRESADEGIDLGSTMPAGQLTPQDLMRPEEHSRTDLTQKQILAPEENHNGTVRAALAIAVLAILFMGGYFVFDFFRHLKPEKTKPVAVQTATVDLKSHPLGAHVYLDGKDTNQLTPTTLSELTLGRKYGLTLVKEGYETLDTTVTIDTAESQPLHFSLKKIIPVDYVLAVKSSPVGAHILFDGKDTGKVTPAEFPGLKIGQQYDIALALTGYEKYAASFRNENPKDQILDVNLLKLKLAGLAVNSTPTGARILMDGQDTGFKTPHHFADIRVPKVVKLALDLEGYAPADETVGLTQEGNEAVTVTLKPLLKKYKLNLASTPAGAKIKINGEDVGTLPLARELPAGKYEVIVELDGHKSQSRTIEIGEADKDVQFSLTPIPATPAPPLTQPPVTPAQKNNKPPKAPTPPITPTTTVPVSKTVVESSSASAAVAKLRVDSTPRGASVTVNGAARGITPIVVKDLPKSTSLTIVVAKKGYKSWQKTLNLLKDYTELNAPLNPQ